MITVPDNLTADFFKRNLEFCEIYNSTVKIKEREKIWKECRNGKTGVVVGGLSAVMLPVKNLGCIISERAGSFVYQKSSFSDFNINHIAGIRAKKARIPFIQGFSTYTSDSFLNKNRQLIDEKRAKKCS